MFILKKSFKKKPQSRSINHSPKETGELFLQLYFFQIFHCEWVLLDIGNKSLGSEGHWNPRQLYYRWDPKFIQGIQKIYLGLFEKDAVLFKKGLADLNLLPFEKLLLEHFGSAATEPVDFNLKSPKTLRTAIVINFLKNPSKIHSDSLVFLMFLYFLHSNLTPLKEPLDVAGAFKKVIPSKPPNRK